MEAQKHAQPEGGRTPRDNPAKAIVVTDGDVAIMKLVNEYRLLRIPDIERLTGRKYQRLHGRLKGLFDHRYLGRIKRPWQKDIYYMARRGLAELLKRGLITDDEAERRAREGELKSDEFLDHELMLADLHIMLTIASQSSPIKLAAWREDKEINDSFSVIVAGAAENITIQPDALFILKDTRRAPGRTRGRSCLRLIDRRCRRRSGRGAAALMTSSANTSTTPAPLALTSSTTSQRSAS